MPTIGDVRQQAHHQLIQSDTPSLDVDVLLCYVLDVQRHILSAYPERELTPKQNARFMRLIAQRAKGVPIAYIIGTRGFYDAEFVVTPDVLIPRPETEILIERAITDANQRTNPTIGDIGTGSGAIAITLARHLPNAVIYATDVSPDALVIARDNAQRLQANVSFHHGYLAEPLITQNIKLDILCANLPYIPTETMHNLAVSDYEPHLALDGGDDGLDLVRELIQQIPLVCERGSLILLEIGEGQGKVTCDYAQQHLNPQSCTIIRDYAKLERIVEIIY